MPILRAGRPYLFWLFLLSWSLVHLAFELEFWTGSGDAVFGKYQPAADPAEALRIGRNVYYTKATWMFALVWLQVLGLPLRTAVAWSFLLYATELLLFFPVRVYAVLNLLLAIGCVIEDRILRQRTAQAAA
ncbi:MAG: hypothetical protein FJ148_14100 [Deltaproteobacteria bacterium]|nr:hypothetical protein [Deltaproteobacteria bacterium]